MSKINLKILDSLYEDALEAKFDNSWKSIGEAFEARPIDNMEDYEVYDYATNLLSNKELDFDTRMSINKILNRIDNANRRGVGYAEKANKDLRNLIKGLKDKEPIKEAEEYPFTHDVTIYYGTNDDGTDDTGEIKIFVDNRKDFPELTDEEIHEAFKDSNLDIWFNDLSSKYEMFDIKIKDGYWLMYKGCEDSGTKPHFVIEKDLKESVGPNAINTLVKWMYDHYNDCPFIGEGKLENGNYVYKFDIKRGTDIDKLKADIKNEYGNQVEFGTAVSEYAPELKTFVVICKTKKNIAESDTGYDYWGPKEMNPFEGKAFIQYYGGPGNLQYLKKAKNGKWVWKDSSNPGEPYLFNSYEDALNVQKELGGEVLSYTRDYLGESESKKPTKRLVMNQGNVYIFEQSKGSKKSYIVGEDVDKDANTIENVNKYKNQDEAFKDFFERIGIDPSNELKESIKEATRLEVPEENTLYVYSNAESEDESDARSMIDAQYKNEAPNLDFNMHKDGPMYFVDFIGSKKDIADYLKKLGWYTDEEIEKFELIKPLRESTKTFKESLKESNVLWTTEITDDDYDKEELKANEYQDYLDNFDGIVHPEDYEDWKDSDWLYNFLYNEWDNENNKYNEWYEFIENYPEEKLKEYYQEYLEHIKGVEPRKPDDFEDWFKGYVSDDTSVWEMAKEDLDDNILPMIDKQVNGAIFITGDYHSNYPDFRKSGPGGKIVRDGEDLINWLSNEDDIKITYEDDEQLGIAAYDHDGSIGGLLYTLPDDPHKILEIALSTDYYKKEDYEDNNDIVEEFLEDLRNDNVMMRDIKKPELLVPIVNGFRTGLVESVSSKGKEDYLISIAREAWSTGQPYSEGDFEEFKKIGKEEGYDLTEEDFSKYFDYYKDCQEVDLKESDDIEGEEFEYTQEYTVEDLDKMTIGIPVAITLKQMLKPKTITALYSGKYEDTYYFYDEGGTFAFSKKYIENGDVFLTNGVDPYKVVELNKSLDQDK